MLKYLVILLDDSSVSFCHYEAGKEKRLISPDDLKTAILFAMKENLNVQIVWPDYELPQEYKDIIATVDHTNIVPLSLTSDADIVVADAGCAASIPDGATVVARLTLEQILNDADVLMPLLRKAARVNAVVVDADRFADSDIEAYRKALDILCTATAAEYVSGHSVQLNLLTDRLMLDSMNNCNAGDEWLAVAPDGCFYPCPAFYYNGGMSVGSLTGGPAVKNAQLYRLDHAPICRKCDAWHCRRCIWLNRRLTLEVNTPGRQQCVMAHLEREASRRLNTLLREKGYDLAVKEIKELDYLDPFDVVIKDN